jgi:hypothetical protein
MAKLSLVTFAAMGRDNRRGAGKLFQCHRRIPEAARKKPTRRASGKPDRWRLPLSLLIQDKIVRNVMRLVWASGLGFRLTSAHRMAGLQSADHQQSGTHTCASR